MSPQHLQALLLLRATRRLRHAIVPDGITGRAAFNVHRKRQQHLQT